MLRPVALQAFVTRVLPAIAVALIGTLGSVPEAQATIQVVPDSPQDSIILSSCLPPCSSATTTFGSATQPLSLTTSNGFASGSITFPAAGLPSMAVGVTLTPAGYVSTAQANYINTITLRYTGPGPAPTSQNASISWTVIASMPSSGSGNGMYGGSADIAYSQYYSQTSNTGAYTTPLTGSSYTFSRSGTDTLQTTFTITNGVLVAYEASLSAFDYAVTTQPGLVTLDPQLQITVPNGWEATLGSGGPVGALSAAPEPSALWLFASGLLLLLGLGKRGRYKGVTARIVRR